MAATLASVLAVWLLTGAFTEWRGLRQLERLTQTPVMAVVGDETRVSGLAESLGMTVTSPRGQVASLYYRFLEEEERRDADGDRRWVTLRDDRQAVDFVLDDASGALPVAAASRVGPGLAWTLTPRLREVVGGRRYTEWRLEPGEAVTVIGMSEPLPEAAPVPGHIPFQIVFDRPGQYRPVISTQGEQALRADLGLGVLLRLGAGLALLTAAAVALMQALGQHRLLGYLALLTLLQSAVLVHLGLTLMRQDLQESLERLERLEQRSLARLSALQASEDAEGGPWRAQQIEAIATQWAIARARVQARFEAVPERWLVPHWALSLPPPVSGWPVDAGRVQTDGALVVTRVQDASVWLGMGLAGLLGSLMLWLGWRWIRVKRLIENVPSAEVRGVVPGIAEVKGQLVLLADPESGPLSGRPCAWYQYRVEERRGSGKNARWVTVESRSAEVGFACEDASGRLPLSTSEAEILTRHETTRRQGNRRYRERRLEPGDDLYLLGLAKPQAAHPDRLELGGGEGVPFLIANLPESVVLLRKAALGLYSLALGISGWMMVSLLAGGQSGGFAATDFLTAALTAPLCLLGLTLVLHYNDLVFLRQRVERNRANIAVSLQKRWDLVPNLQAVAARFLEHEQGLQQALTRLRGLDDPGLTSRDTLEQLTAGATAAATLRARVEHYPDLQAEPLLRQVMTTLKDLEDEIAQMRAGFLNALERYETRRQSFPDWILARLFGFSAATGLTSRP